MEILRFGFEGLEKRLETEAVGNTRVYFSGEFVLRAYEFLMFNLHLKQDEWKPSRVLSFVVLLLWL